MSRLEQRELAAGVVTQITCAECTLETQRNGTKRRSPEKVGVLLSMLPDRFEDAHEYAKKEDDDIFHAVDSIRAHHYCYTRKEKDDNGNKYLHHVINTSGANASWRMVLDGLREFRDQTGGNRLLPIPETKAFFAEVRETLKRFSEESSRNEGRATTA